MFRLLLSPLMIASAVITFSCVSVIGSALRLRRLALPRQLATEVHGERSNFPCTPVFRKGKGEHL